MVIIYLGMRVHLKTIRMAVMLSQPRPDMVSVAMSLSRRSSTTFLWVSFFLMSYLTISMMPWLFST